MRAASGATAAGRMAADAIIAGRRVLAAFVIECLNIIVSLPVCT